jgi:hypothetical protein
MIRLSNKLDVLNSCQCYNQTELFSWIVVKINWICFVCMKWYTEGTAIQGISYQPSDDEWGNTVKLSRMQLSPPQMPHCHIATLAVLAQYTYHIHINTHITQNNTAIKNKQSKDKTNQLTDLHKQWRTYYSEESKGNKAIADAGLGGLLSCEMSRLSHCLDNQFIVGG